MSTDLTTDLTTDETRLQELDTTRSLAVEQWVRDITAALECGCAVNVQVSPVLDKAGYLVPSVDVTLTNTRYRWTGTFGRGDKATDALFAAVINTTRQAAREALPPYIIDTQGNPTHEQVQ
jgi:hypothetical protein